MLQIVLNLLLQNKNSELTLLVQSFCYFKSSLILVVEIPGVRGK